MYNNIQRMVGSNLRDMRQSRGYTQQEIADILCISRTAYCLLEAGKRTISVDIVVRLARYYQVHSASFLDE